VSTRDVFSEQELAGLRGFPEISPEEVIRFFTLTAADEAFVASMRQPETVLGVAVQLCSLPWLGFLPDEVTAAPAVAVERLAARLGIVASELAGYGRREQTRTDHLRAVMAYRGWRSAEEPSLKELDEFLLARAMEHDSPTLLFRLACEHLITARVVRPGPVKLLERVATARTRAERETYDRIAHLLTGPRRAELDRLLVVDPGIGMTRLRWLGTGPTEASASAVKTEVRKLTFLRGLDAHTLDLTTLPAERRRHLAAVGRRSSVPALTRRDPHRRYPIVLTLLAQSAVDVLDEVVQLFDQAVSARESRARHKLADQLAERAKRGEDKLALAEEILPVLADPAIPDEQVGGLLRERIGMSRLRAALATPATARLPRDHGHLAVIDASYGYLRQFTPDVLAVLFFAGGPAAASLLEAVDVLRELNASGARAAPVDAPTGFVPARWRGYLDDARTAGNTTAFRHYWELCVLLCLRDALRSGDVYVPGSRRYADPTAYLITAAAWPAQLPEFCALVDVPADPGEALARVDTELHTAVGELEQVLADGRGPVRVDEHGELIIGPLSAEDLPTEVEELRAELTALLPFAPLASAHRARRPHRVPGLLHPRRRRHTPFAGAQTEPAGGDHQPGHESGVVADGRRYGHRLRHAGLDRGVVRAGGHPAGGEPGYHRLPPAAPDDRRLRRRHPVLVGRAAVPHEGEIDHRAGVEPLLRGRGPELVHPHHRSACGVRHEGHRGHRTGGPVCAR